MFKKYLLIFICILFIINAIAQIPVGTFRSHLSGTTLYSLAVSPEYVYAAGESNIVYYNKHNHEIGHYSKAEGLSDAIISQIHYDENSGYLIVAYKNANLDFIKNGSIHNLSDIKDKPITGEKRIKGFLSDGSTLYLVCAFGIVSVDLQNMLIKDTWYTRKGDESYTANALTIYNEMFYIATDKGILHTSIQNPALADFNTWESDEVDFACDVLTPFNNDLYAGDKGYDSLHRLHNGEWQVETRFKATDLRSLKATKTELMICGWGYIDVFDCQGNNKFYHYWGTPNSYADARDAAFDEDYYWAIDYNNGLVQISKSEWTSQCISDNGPWKNDAFRMDYSKGVMAMVPGSITSVWASDYFQPNLNLFANEKWTTLHNGQIPALAGVYDFADVAINPQNSNEYFVGSFHSGLFKFNNSTLLQAYTHANSPLNSNDTADAYIAGVTYDASNNLWISLSYTNTPLMVLKNDGTWQSIPLGSHVPSYSTAVDRIFIDSRGWKWVVCPRVGKVIVLDDNHTISTLGDDRTLSVNMNASTAIETSRVNCLTEDKNGQIWIGCDIGVKIIFNPGNIFNGNVYPQNILVEQNDHVQNLFEYDEITAIAVDDGNRKWIGTVQSGVFLVSADGTKELLHFNADNSPLPSNKINDICINRETGEVFFATANGLISYRGTATEGKENFEEALVFPNPVRETYHGVITVTGLMDNSFCKICDSAGNLVWQGYANGGTLTWDGKDFYGKRPATGVYFVFSSDETGKEKKVSKILFIK